MNLHYIHTTTTTTTALLLRLLLLLLLRLLRLSLPQTTRCFQGMTHLGLLQLEDPTLLVSHAWAGANMSADPSVPGRSGSIAH